MERMSWMDDIFAVVAEHVGEDTAVSEMLQDGLYLQPEVSKRAVDELVKIGYIATYDRSSDVTYLHKKGSTRGVMVAECDEGDEKLTVWAIYSHNL